MKKNEGLAAYVPTYAVIVKLLFVVGFIVIAVVSIVTGNGTAAERLKNSTMWWSFVIMMGVWLACDIVSDVVWRWMELAKRPSDGFVNMIQSMGGVNIVATTLLTAIGLYVVFHNFWLPIVFIISMATTMGYQIMLAKDGETGNTATDGILNYIQQIIVIVVVIFLIAAL